MGQTGNKAKAVILAAIALAVSTYFKENKDRKEVYSTADGYLFENPVFAQNHAVTLEDKNVTPHTNPSTIEVIDDEDVSDDTGTEDDAPPSGAAATQTNK